MTNTSRCIPPVGQRPILTEVPPIAPASVIDFFEACRRLLTKLEGTARNSKVDRQVQESVNRREWSLHFTEAFEQGSYWLIWAAVLTGLAFGMFAL